LLIVIRFLDQPVIEGAVRRRGGSTVPEFLSLDISVTGDALEHPGRPGILHARLRRWLRRLGRNVDDVVECFIVLCDPVDRAIAEQELHDAWVVAAPGATGLLIRIEYPSPGRHSADAHPRHGEV